MGKGRGWGDEGAGPPRRIKEPGRGAPPFLLLPGGARGAAARVWRRRSRGPVSGCERAGSRAEAMREIVHIQAGQCGNQIGAKVPWGAQGIGEGGSGSLLRGFSLRSTAVDGCKAAEKPLGFNLLLPRAFWEVFFGGGRKGRPEPACSIFPLFLGPRRDAGQVWHPRLLPALEEATGN